MWFITKSRDIGNFVVFMSKDNPPGFVVIDFGFKTGGRRTVTYLITTQNCFLLVPGQDTYKDSGNAKIFDFFEKVPEL